MTGIIIAVYDILLYFFLFKQGYLGKVLILWFYENQWNFSDKQLALKCIVREQRRFNSLQYLWDRAPPSRKCD